jgi:hypothetical protein
VLITAIVWAFARKIDKEEQMSLDPVLLDYANEGQRIKLQAVLDHQTYRGAAAHLSCSYSSIQAAVDRVKKKATAAGYGLVDAPPEGSRVLSGEIGEISEVIKTTDELLAYADINPDEWHVTKQVVNCWGNKYQVKAWVSPNEEIPFLKAIDGIKAWKPNTKKFKHKKGNVCAFMSIFDQHFGKLAWREETNSDYDLKIAADLFMSAGRDLLEKVKGFNIEKIVFPLGSDFLHVDNNQNTTFGGTQQDVDSRLPKIFEMAESCVLQLLIDCLAVAPVDVIFVPGNHDKTVSYYLARVIRAWFREVPQIQVCTAPRSRKYVEYGVNLVGLTHGDVPKQERLALLIMDENKERLADKLYLEWLTGHYHKKGEKQYHAGESFGSVVIKSIPSLCGTDAWHYLHGFVNSMRAAEIHLYDKKDGPCGYFPVCIKE